MTEAGGERAARPLRLLLEALLLAGLVAFSLTAVHAHQKDDSPTFDEAVHLFSGAEGLEDGSGWLNPEHPPLLKLAGAWALRPLGLRSPCGGTPCATSPIGAYPRWLYGNAAPAHVLVAAGRRPFPLVLALLAVALHLAVRPLAGPAAGLLAAGLVALDPTFVAHAAYVHTDVGAALAFLAVVALAARAAFAATLDRWLVLGLALGLALVTKFSTALLVPLVALLPLAPALARLGRGEAAPAARGAPRDRVLGALAALGLAGLVVYGVYAFALRSMPPEGVEASVRGYLSGRPARPDEIQRYAALARAVPPLGHYLAGAKGVALLSERGRGANWFRGEVSEEGFPLYFPAAFLLKSTPAFLALLLLAVSLGLARLRGGRVGGPRVAPAVLLALAVSAALLVASTRSAFNIGARHLLPIWALLVFAGAVVVGRGLANRPRLRAVLAVVLVLSAGLSLRSAGASPIAWFNLLAGGPEGGRRWFSDSNVDWGQDLYRLHLFLAERGWEEETTIVAFGGVATNYYSRKARVLDPSVPVRPGRYAVSHMMETLGEPFVREFEGEAAARQVAELVRALKERGRRIALVGGSITVWELPS
ncbi:MAG: glycosyltransferase family 39 protein [Thermoanaerobaculia bacterium]|nr:glycosyltransferase family 39 protein [Thermoanaerobaculia bacterium]